MATPTSPTNVSATVNADDSITVSWDYDPTWFAFDGDDSSLGGFNDGVWYTSNSDPVDQFRVRMERDGTWGDPGGTATYVTYDGSTSYSLEITADSEYPYESIVGVDSEYSFKVRAENSDGNSSYTELPSPVYTTPIPPHNPKVNRTGDNTIEFDAEQKTDIGNNVIIRGREDTGSGYGDWKWLDTVSYSNLPKSFTIGDGENVTLQEDARYQFKMQTHNESDPNDFRSDYVYADYGNEGNVFFEDSFESGDFSGWDSTYLNDKTYVDTSLNGYDGSGRIAESSPEDGSYAAQLADNSYIQADLGDLSGETDVIVKLYVQPGSLDSSTEESQVRFYDGSNWHDLSDLGWEYNRQGWVEQTYLVPDSYLGTNNHLRLRQHGGVGDFMAVDRVVVSDILHEYTKPADPTSLTLDNSTEGQISASWTVNASHSSESVYTHYADIHDSTGEVDDQWNAGSGTTFTGLSDGEKYTVASQAVIDAFYRGEDVSGQFPNRENGYHSSKINATATTQLPAPSSVSVSAASDTGVNISWTDNANNEAGHKVLYGTKFNDIDDWTVNYGGLVSDRVKEGSNSFYSDPPYNTNMVASWEPFSNGKQPDSFTYWYNEPSDSTGGGVRLVNSNGNYEGGTATDNDEYDVDFANTSGHQFDPGHGYNIWIRVHWDFDWSNNEVTVTFEQADGTNSFTDTYTLKEGVDIESVELWNYHSGGWGMGGQRMWFDNLYFSDWASADTTSKSIGGLTQNTTYDCRVYNYTTHTESWSGFASGDTYLNETRSNSSYGSIASSTNYRNISLYESVSSHSGKGASNSIRIVDLLEDVNSVAKASSSDTKRVVTLSESVTSSASTFSSDNLRVVNLLESVSSHSEKGASNSIRIVDLLESVSSHSNKKVSTNTRSGITFEDREGSASWSSPAAASSIRVVDLLEGVESSAALSSSTSSRGGIEFEGRATESTASSGSSSSIRIVDLLEDVSSYFKDSNSFAYNERTSLELVDHKINWDESNAEWYTEWYQESKITGTEDKIGIRSLVVDEAKEPAARVIVEYDGDGNGNADKRSDIIELGQDEEVKEVTGIPIDESGYYRIRIVDYSGYNALYVIDTALIN